MPRASGKPHISCVLSPSLPYSVVTIYNARGSDIVTGFDIKIKHEKLSFLYNQQSATSRSEPAPNPSVLSGLQAFAVARRFARIRGR